MTVGTDNYQAPKPKVTIAKNIKQYSLYFGCFMLISWVRILYFYS